LALHSLSHQTKVRHRLCTRHDTVSVDTGPRASRRRSRDSTHSEPMTIAEPMKERTVEALAPSSLAGGHEFFVNAGKTKCRVPDGGEVACQHFNAVIISGEAVGERNIRRWKSSLCRTWQEAASSLSAQAKRRHAFLMRRSGGGSNLHCSDFIGNCSSYRYTMLARRSHYTKNTLHPSCPSL
jgi:hypothetical protein